VEIFEAIAALRREHGLTFLVIEHRLDVLLDYVERVLVMHEGRLIFDGPPQDAVNDPGVIDAYLGG
jgi:branched-chain amino acid transport system ATP-binding protein